MESFYIYLEDEAPRIGCGWRLVVAKIGWKWVRLYASHDRRQKIRREVWDKIIASKRQPQHGGWAMSNSSRVGKSVSHTKPDMWYFDQLPPSARQALAEAAFNWSAGSVLNRWKRGQRGHKTGKEIAERVREWDTKAIKKSKLYG